MVGYKKIREIGLAFIIALTLTACKVQSPHYINLYVDNLTSNNDTIASGDSQFNMINITLDTVVERNTFIKLDSSFYSPATEVLIKDSFDSTYQNEVRELLKEISDSIQLLHIQLTALQKHLELDTVLKENKNITAVYRQLAVKNDTILLLKNQLNSLQKLDTVYTTVNEVRTPQIVQKENQNITVDYQELNAKNDTIQQLKNQLNTLQKPDTVYIVNEVRQPKIVQKEDQNITVVYQELSAKDDTIQQLKNQLKTLQKPDTDYIVNEVRQPQIVQKENENIIVVYQELSAKNDTILQLKNQLNTVQKPDTVFVVKEVLTPQIVQKENENITVVYQELSAKNDTIQQLKNQLKTKPDTVYVGKEFSAPPQKIDTLVITAYYSKGKTIPESEVLSQITKVIQSKTIDKIILSGYTDISGNATINKRLTDARLDHIYSKIESYIPVEKIYLQNFGDTFASEKIVQSERKVDVKIYFDMEAD